MLLAKVISSSAMALLVPDTREAWVEGLSFLVLSTASGLAALELAVSVAAVAFFHRSCSASLGMKKFSAGSSRLTSAVHFS